MGKEGRVVIVATADCAQYAPRVLRAKPEDWWRGSLHDVHAGQALVDFGESTRVRSTGLIKVFDIPNSEF